MTLQQISYFREVARVRNFTLAAQNLYVSQSSLSHAIGTMEREIGVPLFIRQSRRVQLTSYGEAFLPHAENVLAELDRGAELLEKMRNPMSGTVTVAYSFVNGHALVPKVFNQFYLDNSYEDITVRFQINHHHQKIEEDLALGKMDLAFTGMRSAEGVETLPIARQELVLHLPINHPLAGEKRLSLEQIRDERVTYFGRNLSAWVNKMYQQAGIKPDYEDIEAEFSDWSAQMAYVSLGLGIVIAQRLPVDPELISVVELDNPMRFRNVYLLWASNRQLPPAVEYVRDYCIDYFRRQPDFPADADR